MFESCVDAPVSPYENVSETRHAVDDVTLPRISLPIPCQALRQGIEIACRFTGIRSQGIDYRAIAAIPAIDDARGVTG
jgi:hypothetical protein